MSKEIKVLKNEEQPIAVEVMEQAIIDIAQAMKRISRSRLNRKALVILISKDSGIFQHQVTRVLNSMDLLEKTYLTPKRWKE